jgi:hypothetical protein
MVPDISKSIRWLFSSRGWANRWCRDRTRWHLWNSARFEGYRILREHPPHQRIVFLDPSTIHGPCSNSVNDRHQPAGPSESRSSCIFDLPFRSYVVDVSGATWSDFDIMHSCPVESSVLRSLYSSHACVRCGSMCFAVGKRFIAICVIGVGDVIAPPIVGGISTSTGSLRTGMQVTWLAILVSGVWWFCGYYFLVPFRPPKDGENKEDIGYISLLCKVSLVSPYSMQSFANNVLKS